MEPRPHERGNHIPLLQVGLHPETSMEPRPHERGNPVDAGRAVLLARQTSMEPRPHERGNGGVLGEVS